MNVNESDMPMGSRKQTDDPTIPSHYVGIDASAGGLEAIEAFLRIFSLLRTKTEVDFSFYKPNAVVRRIERRMTVNQSVNLKAYVQFVESNPSELTHLYRELLIGVTRFFRDPATFNALHHTYLPELVAAKQGRELRIWVPGCSTGEEAYSIAIIIREVMEQLGKTMDVKIFATDIDRDAIVQAGNGEYPESIAADVDAGLLVKYFFRKGDVYQIARTIREMVVFAQHNLIKDPPFTHIDLVSCRNLLIYFQPVLQRKAMDLFSFSLTPGGLLFLGTSETTGEMMDYFEALHHKWKIYRCRGKKRQLDPSISAEHVMQVGGQQFISPDSARKGLRRQREEAQLLDRLKQNQPPHAAVFIERGASGAKNGSKEEVQAYDLDQEAQQRISDLENELRFSRENLQATIEELETSNQELRTTQKALEIARNRYFELFNRAPVGYVIMNHRGMIRLANNTLAEMLGTGAGDMRGKPFSAFIDKKKQHLFFSILPLMAKAKSSRKMELLLLGHQKPRLPVLAEMENVPSSLLESGDPARPVILMTISDITEIKSAQHSITQAKREWEKTFDSVAELVAIIDDHHRVKRVNRPLAQRLKRSPQECIGQPCYKLFHNLEAPPDDCPHARMIADGEAHRVERFEKHLGGHYLTSVSPFESVSMGERWCVHVSSDISELKSIEAERLENERKIRRLQKMEAIGTLAGGVAHDFNNILSIILGNIELSLDQLPQDHPVWFNLNEIHTASLRAQNVVRQLLSFARESQHQKKPVLVGKIVSEAVQLMRASLPTSVEIRPDIAPQKLVVLADSTQLQQVVINLCTNAAHAMEEGGGTLSVRLEKKVLTEPEDHLPNLDPGKYALFTVIDSGHGIKPEHLDMIFDPYFTTKEMGKGTGMGLAVVHGIVDNHGGGIHVRSQYGRGTRFSVYLPLTDEGVDTASHSAPPIPRGKERVLVVDDELSLAKLVRAMLIELGYDATYVTDPQSALDLVTTDPKWDLVISDMTMPRMSGDQLIQEIRRINPKVATILYTGFNAKISKDAAMRIGATGYLEKPVDLKRLALAMRAALD